MDFFTFIYLIIFIISILIAHKFFDITNLANPFVMFFIYNTVFFFIGIFYINSYGYYIIENSTKLLISYSYFASTIGALFSELTFARSSNNSNKSIHIIHDNEKTKVLSSLIIFSLGILLYAYFFSKTGFIPDIFSNFEDERVMSRQGFGMIVTLSIGCITFSTVYLLSINNLSKISKSIIFIISSLILLAYGSRGPYLIFILVLFIVSRIKGNNKVTILRILPVALGLFFIMVFLGAIRKGVDINFWNVFIARFGWRPIATIYNFDNILNHFSNYGTLFGGSYIIELQTLLPGYQPNFGTWVKEIVGYKFSGGSLTCSAIGVAYINWGIVGIYVMPIFIGYFLQTLYILFLRVKFITLDKLVFFALISISLWGISTVGIATPIMYNVIPYIIIFTIFKFLNQILRLR